MPCSIATYHTESLLFHIIDISLVEGYDSHTLPSIEFLDPILKEHEVVSHISHISLARVK